MLTKSMKIRVFLTAIQYKLPKCVSLVFFEISTYFLRAVERGVSGGGDGLRVIKRTRREADAFARLGN